MYLTALFWCSEVVVSIIPIKNEQWYKLAVRHKAQSYQFPEMIRKVSKCNIESLESSDFQKLEDLMSMSVCV